MDGVVILGECMMIWEQGGSLVSGIMLDEVGEEWEEEEGKNPGIQISGAFVRVDTRPAQADTRPAQADSSLEELLERTEGATRAGSSLDDSSRADIPSARANPPLEPSPRADVPFAPADLKLELGVFFRPLKGVFTPPNPDPCSCPTSRTGNWGSK
ncbi:hypothetical protein AAC387_Pa05g0901 [Persea americana]